MLPIARTSPFHSSDKYFAIMNTQDIAVVSERPNNKIACTRACNHDAVRCGKVSCAARANGLPYNNEINPSSLQILEVKAGILGLRQNGTVWHLAEGETTAVHNGRTYYWWNASNGRGSSVAFAVHPLVLTEDSSENQYIFTNRGLSRLQRVLNILSNLSFHNGLKRYHNGLFTLVQKIGVSLSHTIVQLFCKTDCNRVCLNNSCKSPLEK